MGLVPGRSSDRFESTLSGTAVDSEDLDAVEHVVDALDDYASIRSQGPVWLTGSAQNDPSYGDIDIVVERGTEEYGQESFNSDHDHEAIYDLLVDSENYDIDPNADPLEGLIESDSLDVNRMQQYDIPVHRYQFEINGTEFDINFCHSPPQDGGIQLTPFYGQE